MTSVGQWAKAGMVILLGLFAARGAYPGEAAPPG
jgi:hypothetical protein